MRLLNITFFVFSLLIIPQVANADGLVREMKVGILNHDTNGLWSGFNRERGIDGNIELIFNSEAPLWGGEVRPAFGVSVNSSGDTSKLYGAARWETTVGESFLFALGIGAAVHTGETTLVRSDRKALGSKVLFYFPIEAGYRINDRDTVSLFFDHLSNAWLASPNEGMDTLGIRYGYRF